MFEALHKSRQLSVIVLDRLGDYVELLRIEMKIQGRELGVRLLGYAIGLAFTLLVAIFTGIAIILTYWDTPQRAAAAWLVVGLYAAVAVISFMVSIKHLHGGSAFTALRNELRRDAKTVKESL